MNTRKKQTEIHYKLLAKISDYIDENEGNLPKLKAKLKHILSPVDVSSDKSLLEVFDAMESRGHLEPGRYKELKSALREDHENIIKMIEKTEREMGININREELSSSLNENENGSGDHKQYNPDVENKKLHTHLMAKISDYLSQELGNIAKFKTKLKSHLAPVHLSKDKTFLDIQSIMESKGLLKVGYYDHLIDALREDNNNIVKLIKETESLIKENNRKKKEVKKRNKRNHSNDSSVSSPKKRKPVSEDDGNVDTSH